MFDFFTIFCLQLLSIGHSQLAEVGHYILKSLLILLCGAIVHKFDKLFCYCAPCIACRRCMYVSQNQEPGKVIFCFSDYPVCYTV